MRAMTILTTLLLATAMTSLGTAGATPDDPIEVASVVTMTLLVHNDFAGALGQTPGEPALLPGTAECTLTVFGGSNAADVLDKARDDQCILEWDYDDFGGDRFVSSVDGLRAACPLFPEVCFFWLFIINGVSASHGIDDYVATEGDVLEFHLIQA